MRLAWATLGVTNWSNDYVSATETVRFPRSDATAQISITNDTLSDLDATYYAVHSGISGWSRSDGDSRAYMPLDPPATVLNMTDAVDVTFYLHVKTRSCNATGLVFLYSPVGPSPSPPHKESSPEQKEYEPQTKTCVVYGADTGEILHTHAISVFPGGSPATVDDVAQEALELTRLRQLSIKGELEVLHVSKDRLSQLALGARVNSDTRDLITPERTTATCHICNKKKSVSNCSICGAYYCAGCASPILRSTCKKCAP